MFLKDTYLSSVRRRNKLLFYAIAIFIACTLAANVSKNEITPFFVWSMYAGTTPNTDTFRIYVLEYNDGKIFNEPHTWKDHKRMMFFYTIDQYTLIKNNGGKDPDELKTKKIIEKMHIQNFPFPELYNTEKEIQNYPGWLKRYMQANLSVQMDSIKVYRKWVKFNDNGQVLPIKSELLFKA